MTIGITLILNLTLFLTLTHPGSQVTPSYMQGMSCENKFMKNLFRPERVKELMVEKSTLHHVFQEFSKGRWRIRREIGPVTFFKIFLRRNDIQWQMSTHRTFLYYWA